MLKGSDARNKHIFTCLHEYQNHHVQQKVSEIACTARMMFPGINICDHVIKACVIKQLFHRTSATLHASFSEYPAGHHRVGFTGVFECLQMWLKSTKAKHRGLPNSKHSSSSDMSDGTQ